MSQACRASFLMAGDHQWLHRRCGQPKPAIQCVFGGSANRMCSSRSCLSPTAEGAFIIRSCACWFSGKAITSRMFCCAGQQHDDAVDARRHAAVRRRAVAEGVQHAAELLAPPRLAE